MPTMMAVPRKGKILVNGVRLDIDEETGRVLNSLLINETMEDDL